MTETFDETISEISYELFIDICTLRQQGYTKADYLKHQARNFGGISSSVVLELYDTNPLEPKTVLEAVEKIILKGLGK
jgi:hypothetical protein